jgi:hypothetical protein
MTPYLDASARHRARLQLVCAILTRVDRTTTHLIKDALDAGVPEKSLVELMGEMPAIRRVAGRVKRVAHDLAKKRKARRKMEKLSRKANAR